MLVMFELGTTVLPYTALGKLVAVYSAPSVTVGCDCFPGRHVSLGWSKSSSPGSPARVAVTVGDGPTWWRLQRERLRDAWQSSCHAPARTSGVPHGNAQEPVWSAHAPLSDLVSYGAPPRLDVRVRPDREVQQLSDGNRAYVLLL